MPSPSRSAAPCRAIAGRPPPTSAEPLPGEVSQQVVGFGAFAALERGKPTGESRVVRIAEFFLAASLHDPARGKADELRRASGRGRVCTSGWYSVGGR